MLDHPKIAQWREQAATGTIPVEDLKEAIQYLRQCREEEIAAANAKKANALAKVKKTEEPEGEAPWN